MVCQNMPRRMRGVGGEVNTDIENSSPAAGGAKGHTDQSWGPTGRVGRPGGRVAASGWRQVRSPATVVDRTSPTQPRATTTPWMMPRRGGVGNRGSTEAWR